MGKLRLGTLFTGFGGADIGGHMAGLVSAWGVEYDPKIAAVAQNNGLSVTVANILNCDPADFPAVDVIHASPPCPSFSVANAGGSETDLDRDLAAAVCLFLVHHRPLYFSLENVYQYRRAAGFQLILRVLRSLGYGFDYFHLNAADYGAPTKRLRLILLADRSGRKPGRPPATHHKKPARDLFGLLPSWVSWYDAIADLIPLLPDDNLADWQVKYLKQNSIVDKSLLVFSVSGGLAGKNHKTLNQPAQTLRAGAGGGSIVRVYLVPGGNPSNGLAVDQKKPAVTLTAGNYNIKITDNSGAVKRLNGRALARLQSFPDDYLLPENDRLCTLGIGNSVPPLMAAAFFRKLINGGVNDNNNG